MNFKKILFVFAFIISTTAFSQKWAEDQGQKLTDKLNTTLVSTNDDLKLTIEQASKIKDVYTNLMVEKSKVNVQMKKEGTFNKQAFWKATFPQQKAANQKIREILSVAQKQAFNASLQK
ncbi:hypothetical protein [Wenyingzhuangia aestuarii]|uniref:hypothetical protein n=1 Tax=Wenyingzhuangia aestuarii TaxID=1647582 RepID=UPI00143A9AE6|nr:hypothetical protein [Wenyingzhuangia aestuarii]NJB82755.1 hypothetical protein [Wenyingzhuangia aestuarii]